MERLMLSKDTGAYTHQGAQPPVHESMDAPIPFSTGLPSSLTLFNFPPPSILESAKQLYLSDITSQSSAPNNMGLPPDVDPVKLMYQLIYIIKSLTEILQRLQRTHVYVLPPPPPPPAPAPSAYPKVEAILRFLDYADKSKKRNDEWLSEDDIVKMYVMFQEDENAAKLYTAITDGSNGDDELIRVWVQRELDRLGGGK